MLRDEGPSDAQLTVLRAMTPAQRWAAARSLYWSARRLKAAHLRAQHPDCSEGDVEELIRRTFLYARS